MVLAEAWFNLLVGPRLCDDGNVDVPTHWRRVLCQARDDESPEVRDWCMWHNAHGMIGAGTACLPACAFALEAPHK